MTNNCSITRIVALVAFGGEQGRNTQVMFIFLLNRMNALNLTKLPQIVLVG